MVGRMRAESNSMSNAVSANPCWSFRNKKGRIAKTHYGHSNDGHGGSVSRRDSIFLVLESESLSPSRLQVVGEKRCSDKCTSANRITIMTCDM